VREGEGDATSDSWTEEVEDSHPYKISKKVTIDITENE
jgi:hypothetical protein